MSTIDLVKAAQERKYLDFENLALEMLKKKVTSNPIMQRKLSELDQAQNLDESEDITITVDFYGNDSMTKKNSKKYKVSLKDNGDKATISGSKENIKSWMVAQGYDISKKDFPILFESKYSKEDFLQDFMDLVDNSNINYMKAKTKDIIKDAVTIARKNKKYSKLYDFWSENRSKNLLSDIENLFN